MKQSILIGITIAMLSGCGGDEAQPQSGNGSAVMQPAAPVFSVTPAEVIHEPYARVEFGAEQVSGFECQLNDDDISGCISPLTLLPLESGSHVLRVWSVAADGRRSDAAEITWRVSSPFDSTNIHQDLVASDIKPAAADPGSWRGIFRINCDFAHSSYNDPIVYPGQRNAAHLHRFYGNTLVDENTNTESLFTSGESSCQGNTLNRSSYWVPALLAPKYDAVTQERLLDANGEPAWQVVPAVVGNDDQAHEIFYYSAGIDDIAAIQPIPVGLKMIAGTPAGAPGSEQDSSVVRWHCQSWESSDASNPRWSAGIPECQAPDRLRMDVFFPSCWNGIDLDSADHRSHLAYPDKISGTVACPATHPVAIVRVSYHYAFGVKPDVYDPQTQSSRGWRLASDKYEVTNGTPGGMSLHADWFNGWHPDIMNAVLNGCIKSRLDCHDGNLANGFRLTGTRPGSQAEPDIVNMGMGY